MPDDVTISGLPAAGPLSGAELMPVVQPANADHTGMTPIGKLADILDNPVFSQGVNGAVPAPAAGNGAAQLTLCADGTWRNLALP